jgi:hypothetical protein
MTEVIREARLVLAFNTPAQVPFADIPRVQAYREQVWFQWTL